MEESKPIASCQEEKPKEHIEYVFIDESGDLGKYGSAYFSIVAIVTHNPSGLSRIIKRVRESKFKKKKMKDISEIKANNSRPEIKKAVLERLSRCDCKISAIAVPKTRVREDLFKKNEKLYNYLYGQMMEHISLNTDIVDITVDKKSGNRLLQEDFNQYIEMKLKGRNPNITVRIRHLESHASKELQAVDFVAWAVNRKYTHSESTYYELISDKITNKGKENIWEK